MSEMVERVATAIGNRLRYDSNGECLLIPTDDQCRDIARAAIEAMREPTRKMINAAWNHRLGGGLALNCWHDMIDEALK